MFPISLKIMPYLEVKSTRIKKLIGNIFFGRRFLNFSLQKKENNNDKSYSRGFY